MTPEAQAIIDAANALDAKYAALQQSDAALQDAVNVAQSRYQSMLADYQTLNSALNDFTTLRAGVGVAVQRSINRLPFVTDPNARPLMKWFQPGPTGNTNPKPTDPHGSWGVVQSDGGTKLTVTPAAAWNNFFFGFNLIQGTSQARRYVQVVTFELPDDQIANCNGIETNWEHSLGGYRYNQGTQLLIAGGKGAQVRYYDIAAQAWNVLPNVPMPPLGTGKPVTIINEVERVTGAMHFLALTINGIRYVVDKTTQAVKTPWSEYLQHGFQLDTMGSAKPYSVNLQDTMAGWI